MAKPSDLAGDVEQALASRPPEAPNPRTTEKEAQQARRIQALSWQLAGLTKEQIAERLKISPSGVRDLLKRTLDRAEKQNVEEQRSLENERLDRAQAAIWADVLAGDTKAIQTFLAISRQRVALNGLNAPTRIEVSSGIRDEMRNALGELEALVDQHGKQRYDDEQMLVVHEKREISERSDE